MLDSKVHFNTFSTYSLAPDTRLWSKVRYLAYKKTWNSLLLLITIVECTNERLWFTFNFTLQLFIKEVISSASIVDILQDSLQREQKFLHGFSVLFCRVLLIKL